MLFLREPKPTMPFDLTLLPFFFTHQPPNFISKQKDMKVTVQARTADQQQDYSVTYHNNFRHEVSYELGHLVLLLNLCTKVALTMKFTHFYQKLSRVLEQTFSVNYSGGNHTVKISLRAWACFLYESLARSKTVLLESNNEPETPNSSDSHFATLGRTGTFKPQSSTHS